MFRLDPPGWTKTRQKQSEQTAAASTATLLARTVKNESGIAK